MEEQIIISVIKLLVIFGGFITIAAYTTLAERKVSAYMQFRIGPNRVGPFGLLQPLADVMKMVFKEELIPAHVNAPFYVLGPAIMIFVALLPWAAIPFGENLSLFGHEIAVQITDLNVGVLYILAVSSLGVYGIMLGGWASNNKFSLMGAVRASAQLISYEITIGLTLAAIFLLTGGVGTREIITAQMSSPWQWNIFVQPIGFIIFMTSVLAETNRNPFDLAEAESELVVGYHTEYGGFKMSLYLLSEYINMVTSSALITLLYFGGWSIPFVNLTDFGLPQNVVALISIAVFVGKTLFFIFVFLWIRWTLPRFRYDQLMNLGWKGLLPLSILNLMGTALAALLV